MIYRRILVAIVSTLLAGTLPPMAQAGSGAAGTSAGAAADQAWSDLLLLSASPPPPAPGARRTRDEHAALHAQQLVNSRHAAQAANKFYTQYPGDPRAEDARKLEAISALRGVEPGDPTQEASAIAIAKAFRTDPNRAARDRLDVGIAMDTQELNIKLKAGLIADGGSARKQLLAAWRAEFGDSPELESYAMRLARQADPATATAMAAQIAASSQASAATKREAVAITARATLLGSPVKLALTLVDGGTLNVEEQTNHVTVVVVWSPGRPESLGPLQAITSALPRGAEIVALALGGTPGDIARVRHSLPAVKYFAHAPKGAAANAAARTLKLQFAPYAYIVNGAGVLTDFGPLAELPDLLVRAGVVTLKHS